MMKHFVSVLISAFAGLVFPIQAQIGISTSPYSQDFNSLGEASAPWTNNLTLPGWYASKGSGDATNFLAGTGSGTAGGMYSFGASNSSDRSLGTLAASAIAYAFGVRFVNNTAASITNISISYVGKQWRAGAGVTNANTLAFTFQAGAGPLTNAAAASGWTAFSALDFVSPNLSGTGTSLDGNASSNQQVFANIPLPGITLAPGQELFLRWRDVDDSGFDHALAVDDLTVQFNGYVASAAPVFTLQPQSQSVTEGDTVLFVAAATGSPAPAFQWQWHGTNLPGATGGSLTLNGVTTNQSGPYRVVATNSAGTTLSSLATLTVNPALPGSATSNTVALLTYNVKGNGATNWTTNAPQVKAIARQVQYLNPDIITFNEIPFDLAYEMTNFVNVFLPGFALARNSGGDGFIRSVIVSRYPITRSSSWLDGADLKPFGYTNTSSGSADNFTRDLFEAQINIPGFPRPLHVFTTHLKATSGTNYFDSAAKRAAEAAAITNFFATNLFAHYPLDPYTLSGDMNDADTNTLAIQRLASPPTGLKLTNPKNSVTGSINTYSTATANPGERLDYIFPGALLAGNIRTSMVFRTDLLNPVPANLNSNDAKVASDHLPVLMVFNHPYDKPLQFTSISRSNPAVRLSWTAVFGQAYRLESSSNQISWSLLDSNVVATNFSGTVSYTTNLSEPTRSFRVSRSGP